MEHNEGENIWFDLINAWILPKLHPKLRLGKVD